MNLLNDVEIHRWKPAAAFWVSGDDARTFLQGQFTNDLGKADEPGGVYGLWLNQKGKVLADSSIRHVAELGWLVVSYSSPAAVIRERLEAYIIADDVVLTDVTTQVSGLSVLASTHAELALPKSVVRFAGRRGVAGYDLIFPETESAGVDAIFSGANALDADRIECLRVRAGVPAVPRDIGPGDLPQEGSLEAAAISFTKGCYLGQEVMARLKSMGQVRRRLVRIEGSGAAPTAGTPLFQDGKKVGEVRSAVRQGDAWLGIAMISLVLANTKLAANVIGPAGPAAVLGDLL